MSNTHMTRAHFQLIASVVRNCCDTCKIPKIQRLRLAQQFAIILQHTNPQFSYFKFIDAATKPNATDE